MKIYISGKLYDKEDAKISVYDHGFLYGDGVFEGIRSYGGKVFRWRNTRSPLEFRQSHLARNPHQQGRNGPGNRRNPERQRHPRRLHPRSRHPRSGHVGIGSQSLQRSAGDRHRRSNRALSRKKSTARDWKSSPSSTQRNHPAALSPRIKSLNYLNNILAKIEGMQAGCIEALMLNHKGEVAECTGDNIFLVRHGKLQTPPNEAGILEGVTRTR